MLSNADGLKKIAAIGAEPVVGVWSKLTSVVECQFKSLVAMSDGELSKMDAAKAMATCWWDNGAPSEDELRADKEEI